MKIRTFLLSTTLLATTAYAMPGSDADLFASRSTAASCDTDSSSSDDGSGPRPPLLSLSVLEQDQRDAHQAAKERERVEHSAERKRKEQEEGRRHFAAEQERQKQLLILVEHRKQEEEAKLAAVRANEEKKQKTKEIVVPVPSLMKDNITEEQVVAVTGLFNTLHKCAQDYIKRLINDQRENCNHLATNAAKLKALEEIYENRYEDNSEWQRLNYPDYRKFENVPEVIDILNKNKRYEEELRQSKKKIDDLGSEIKAFYVQENGWGGYKRVERYPGFSVDTEKDRKLRVVKYVISLIKNGDTSLGVLPEKIQTLLNMSMEQQSEILKIVIDKDANQAAEQAAERAEKQATERAEQAVAAQRAAQASRPNLRRA